MKKIIIGMFALVLSSLLTMELRAGTVNDKVKQADNIQLFYSGPTQPNSENTNGFAAFPRDVQALCTQNFCVPTTQIPLTDAVSGKTVGDAHIWGTNFLVGTNGSLCFTEVIEYRLNMKSDKRPLKGNVYTISDVGSTCGAFTDPTLPGLVPVGPEFGGVVVVAGGGGGHGNTPPDAQGISHGIVGATGDFTYLIGGNYLDRVFVEFEADHQTITYYNGLYITLSPPKNGGKE